MEAKQHASEKTFFKREPHFTFSEIVDKINEHMYSEEATIIVTLLL